jgi:hypothetical protein
VRVCVRYLEGGDDQGQSGLDQAREAHAVHERREELGLGFYSLHARHYGAHVHTREYISTSLPI